MTRTSLVNSILAVIAIILFTAVLMQSGLFGNSLKISRIIGIEKEAVSIAADDYIRCKQNGGTITLQVPRLCQSEGKSYYESYAVSDEIAYRTEVENEAAQMGRVIAAPANKATLNMASYDSLQKSIVSYASRYASNENGGSSFMLLANSHLRDLSDGEITVWKTLTNAKQIGEVATLLGGNTASISAIDLSQKGISKSVVFVDGEGDRLFGSYSVIVAGEVRDNFVLMQAPLVIDNFTTLLNDCLGSSEVTAAQDKDVAAQTCLNKKVGDSQAIQSNAQTIAKKLSETFSFSL